MKKKIIIVAIFGAIVTYFAKIIKDIFDDFNNVSFDIEED